MSNCYVELTEWISDRELLDLIYRSNYRFLGTSQGVDLYIDTTEEQLQQILQRGNGLSELERCINQIHFSVEGVQYGGFHPRSIIEFQMEQTQYYNYVSDLQKMKQIADIPERFDTPVALIDYLNGTTLIANQAFATLFDTTAEAIVKINLLQYWEHGLEQLVGSLRKYGKVRQLPCCVCLGIQSVPTWIIVNALLIEKELSICLVEIINSNPFLRIEDE